MSFENWTIEDLFTRCMDCDDMTLEMDREEFSALRKKIAELQNHRAALQPGNSGQPVTVPDESWRIEADKQAEIYEQSFVVFRNGEQPQCADPTKVVISFTDKGLGHRSSDAALVIPDGLIAAVNRLLDSDGSRGCYDAMVRGNAREEIERLLAAAPTVHDGWIPVSERMPEPGRWLALYGAPVYTRGPDAGKPWCKFSVGEGYLDKEDGKFYLLNWESPGEIGDSYNNLLAIATHWMYWELPDAPKVKP